MFVEYETELDAGLGDVENELERLRADAGELADIAYREGESLQARVGPSELIARRVDLSIGTAEVHSLGLVYPIHWTASGATVLFPELKADLILAKRGANRTSLTLRGTYQPPLGMFGRLADRAVLGRIAEATVRNWVDRLSASIAVSASRHSAS